MGYFVQDDAAVPARTPDTHTRVWELSVGGLRYYIPAVGRWASRDPIGELDTRALYLYCRNAAIACTDAMGLASVPTPSSMNAMLAVLWAWLLGGGGKDLSLQGDVLSKQEDVEYGMYKLVGKNLAVGLCKGGPLTGGDSEWIQIGGGQKLKNPVLYWTIDDAKLTLGWSCKETGACCYDCALTWILGDKFDLNPGKEGYAIDVIIAMALESLGVEYKDPGAPWWWKWLPKPPGSPWSPVGPKPVTMTAYAWKVTWNETVEISCPMKVGGQ